MTPGMKSFALTATLAFLLPASGALADRAPTLEERAEIEAVLQNEGYTSWDSIEFDEDSRDEGVWEIDDAIGADGTQYDLELDAELNIVDRDRD